MNWKSFLLGVLAGVVMTFFGLFVYGLFIQKAGSDNDIQYLDRPVSYENKSETSFQVFQVLGNIALANEVSNPEYKWYNGNTVVIVGENYYTDQVLNVKNPRRIGTYNYTTQNGMPMTVPVIEGEIE